MSPAPTVETAISRWIATFAGGAAPGRILDVGCGTRPYEPLFTGWEYIGIDVAVSGRPAEYKVVDQYFDGHSIPYPDESFDAVLCTEVLEHCVDATRIAGEIRRVLRPGGNAVITVPFMWGEHEMPYDFRRYSINGITQMLESVGLEVIRADRSQPGIDAIAALVASEINNSVRNLENGRLSIRARFVRQVEPYLWTILRRLWQSQYAFVRVYVDNLVVARRPFAD
jgi:SAM-dependent methyltransferase